MILKVTGRQAIIPGHGGDGVTTVCALDVDNSAEQLESVDSIEDVPVTWEGDATQLS